MLPQIETVCKPLWKIFHKKILEQDGKTSCSRIFFQMGL